MTKKVLYISYDGMTDPLGQSQVLPYLKGLTRYGYKFTILSFEKKERFEKTGAIIREIMKETGIEWVHLFSPRARPCCPKCMIFFSFAEKPLNYNESMGST